MAIGTIKLGLESLPEGKVAMWHGRILSFNHHVEI